MLLRRMFQRKWLLTTLLVLVGTAICIRLGIWQLDRLEQRRIFNAHYESSRTQPTLILPGAVPPDIQEMEWRSIEVTGEYDFANQVAIRNQYYRNEYGYHLFTPLRFGDSAVLVDRGWIPAEGNETPSDWRKYDEPGAVQVSGQIRLGQGKPAIGGVADPLPPEGGRLAIWNNADLARIAQQLPYAVLPVFVQQAMDPDDTDPPIPVQPEVELTEGPHFGYALQWFTFAAILFFGYPFFVQKQESALK